MIGVSRRAHRYDDRAGDPLDGLVNLFDVGVVLAVAFLLAALASLNLTSALGQNKPRSTPSNEITVPPSSQVSPVPSDSQRTVGRGTPVGRVYRLDDGTLIYVLPSATQTLQTPQPSSTP